MLILFTKAQKQEYANKIIDAHEEDQLAIEVAPSKVKIEFTTLKGSIHKGEVDFREDISFSIRAAYVIKDEHGYYYPITQIEKYKVVD